MAADPMPTDIDALPAWIARHFAPRLRASVFQRLAPRVREAQLAASRPAASGGGAAGVPGGAPAAPAPLPGPTAVQQAGLDQIGNRLAAVPIRGNAGRQALWAEGGRGLTDAGLLDIAGVDIADRAPDGTVSYRIDGRGEGQRLRDARGAAAGAFNSRGAFFSSARRNADIDAAREVANRREAVLRGLAGRQTDSINADVAAVTDLLGERSIIRGEIADAAAAAPVAPSDPVAALGGAASPRPAAAPPALPAVVRNPGAGSIAGLRRRGYTRRGTSNIWTRS